MAEPKKRKPARDETQRERFVRIARELGCDEDEAAFDQKLRRVASHKPETKRGKKS